MRSRAADHGLRIGIGAVAALSVAAAQPPAAEFAELDTLARAELQTTSAPGAAIAIVKGGRVVYQTGIGVANRRNRPGHHRRHAVPDRLGDQHVHDRSPGIAR